MIVTVTDLYDGVTPETSPVTITVIEGSATSGGGGAVDSVNGDTGVVVLDAADVGADATGTAAAAVAAHEAAVNPHPVYLTQVEGDGLYEDAGAAAAAQSAAETTAASALSTHAADTTSVHGIADTANLVLTNDSRLTDARTPTAHATSHQDGGTDELALDGSQITSGTVADARIASTIARDSEVAAGYQPLDSDLTAIAALTTTSYGRALLAVADLSALRTILGPTGSPSSSTYLRGDGSWSTPVAAVPLVTTVRTAGNVSITTTEASVDTGIDLTIAAVAGDRIGLCISAFLDSASGYVIFDFATVVSSAITNYIHDGGTAMDDGNPGWFSHASAIAAVTGEALYVVQAGDISGGNVTFRLRATCQTGTRTLRANTTDPLRVWAKNYGQ